MEQIKNTTPIYISGPISGVRREVFMERFAAAEKSLRSLGYVNIVNPTRLWVCRFPWLYKLLGYKLTLFIDLWLLTRCRLIYKMPDWRDSRGAQIESCVAYHFNTWTVNKQQREIVDDAVKKINKGE